MAENLSPSPKNERVDSQARSNFTSRFNSGIETTEPDELIVHSVPVVLPVMGAVLMFLLAFIAIYMT